MLAVFREVDDSPQAVEIVFRNVVQGNFLTQLNSAGDRIVVYRWRVEDGRLVPCDPETLAEPFKKKKRGRKKVLSTAGKKRMLERKGSKGTKMLVAESTRINAIGYEGATIERFLSCLKDNQIELVIDVRANPISRKRGFSKTALRANLASVGIDYVHFPILGIPSRIRKDYDDIYELLDYYDEHILTRPEVQEAAEQVAQLCRERTATIMCFEANPRLCHRSRLARYVERRFDLPWNFIEYK